MNYLVIKLLCMLKRSVYLFKLVIFIYYRLEDAIKILEYILKVREEKLGTANPDVDDEKKRLAKLLKEVGRARNKKGKSLGNLLHSNSQRIKEGTKRWSAFGFKT